MSFIPGRNIFRQRSELSSPVNGLLALVVLVVTTSIAIAFFQAFDGLFVGSTLVSQVIIIGTGLALVSQVILRRSTFKARWSERAFSVAFRWLAIPGLTLVGAGLAHFAWIEGPRLVPHEITLAPFMYLLVTGIVLWLRTILVLGIDNLSMLYVYFPNEGRLVDSSIYRVLRHPVYSAAIRVGLALVLWNGSALALFAGLMTPLTMTAWLRWVEEPELIERFGDGYRAYRARVPAFFNLNPRIWPVVWRFLLTGQ
jgi:protein-S-isoprenylcysteine O-methyltransferase Ste14